jgi:ribonuclease HI
MKDKIVIFCDGASKGNPGPGGFGAVIVLGDQVLEIGGFEAKTTNNRMELSAAMYGLKEAETNLEIDVYTDSRYLISGITKWVFGWQKNNWKTKNKEEVLNKDLWLDLAYLIKNKKINWHYVGGHIGIAGNERCDEIASGFAMGEDVKLYAGSLKDYKIDVLNLNHSHEKKDAKKSGLLRKNSVDQKAYSYLSLVNGVLNIDKTWAECEKRVKGVKGTKYKKSISAENEREIIKEWGI